jgi:hypothetical protein
MIGRWSGVGQWHAVLLGAAVVLGCDRSPPPVLFHSDAHAALPAAEAGARADAGAPGDAAAPPPLGSSQVLGDGTTIAVDGVTAHAAEGERFTQYLTLDPDGDGDRDLFVVRARADGTPLGLGMFRREPTSFAAVPVGGNSAPSEARCNEAALRSRSQQALVVSYRCPSGAGGGAGPDAGAGTAGSTGLAVEHVVVRLAGGAPSVRLRVAELLPALPDTQLGLAVDAVDRDGDGSPDVVVEIAAGRPGEREDLAARATLVLFERAGGYARDTSEPESSFARLAGAARLQLGRRRGAEALATIERIVRLRRAICSDAGTARVRVGNDLGVPCGASAGLRAASEVLARALLVSGEAPAALAQTRRETAGDLPPIVTPRLLADINRALPAEAGVVARSGPALGRSLDALPHVRASVLALSPAGAPTAIDVRGPAAARVDLSSLVPAPAPPADASAVWARSLDGALAVQGLHETCTGLVVALCPSSAPECMTSAAPAIPAAAQLVRVTALPPAENAVACLRDPSHVAPASRASGARVVGFGREGLIVAYRARLFRVTPGAGTAAPLAAGAPLGGPFPPGSAASESGEYAVLASPDALLVRDGAGRWHRWSAPNLAGRTGELTDLTISNDGRTVAALSNGQLWIIERPGPAPVVTAPSFVPGVAPGASAPPSTSTPSSSPLLNLPVPPPGVSPVPPPLPPTEP